MTTLLERRFETETPTLRVSDEYYRWRLVPKPQKAPRDSAVINKHNGALYISGYNLRFADPVVHDLYAEFTGLLDKEGITLPGPDPKFKDLEGIIEGISSDPSALLHPNPKPENGTPLLLITNDRSRFSRRARSSRVVYAGIVEATWLRNALFSRDLEMEIDLVRPDTYRLDYAHFTPDEEHIIGVYRWEEAVELYKGDQPRSDWYPKMFKVEPETIDTITKQIAEGAVPQKDHPGSIGSQVWERLREGEPRRIAEIVQWAHNQLV